MVLGLKSQSEVIYWILTLILLMVFATRIKDFSMHVNLIECVVQK